MGGCDKKKERGISKGSWEYANELNVFYDSFHCHDFQEEREERVRA